jgi:xenotropic and polytropic retrovirus receptor 1
MSCCDVVIFICRSRRFCWNFFRLENEHLNNVGQFRAVRDISIAPLDSNDQALLEHMMDDEDGVVNRQSSITKRRLMSLK